MLVRNALGFVVALSLFATTQIAFAQDVEIGVGAFGSVGAVFLDAADDESDPLNDVYPGFGGDTHGGGISVEARLNGFAAIEANYVYSVDYGAGEINDRDFEIGQPSSHIPVLLKLIAPSEGARPFLLVGYEFVLPHDASATVDGDDISSFDASADSYNLATVGFGMEFMVPTPTLDLRIPVSFRAGFNSDTPDTPSERADWVAPGGLVLGADFLSEWQYQIMVTIGLSAFFNVTD